MTRFRYLGSWITEAAGSYEDIRSRVKMAKAAFWQKYGVGKREPQVWCRDENIKFLCVLYVWSWNFKLK